MVKKEKPQIIANFNGHWKLQYLKQALVKTNRLKMEK